MEGRGIGPAEIRAAKAHPLTKAQWMPALRQKGFFVQHSFGHVGVLGGVGLGGGSLVWGAVMLPPKAGFYAAPVWQELGIDMQAELAPHLDRAKRMLGVQANPGHGWQDDYLKATASAMGVGKSWGKTPQAIYFGQAPALRQADPYFGGEGPERTSCRFCGGCLAGCEYGSKNSLDCNYLHLAQKRGVQIHTETQVLRIEALAQGGYRVHTRHPWKRGMAQSFQAHKLVLAAGVIGTLDLLLRARDVHRTLPAVSARCGEMVRTNSEALTAVLSRDP
ncbi:MAG: GMC family oxidoreductase N-terminal domain-containing protein, partial [Oceanococcaceae bacterium]